jgi:hypothetical protein
MIACLFASRHQQNAQGNTAKDAPRGQTAMPLHSDAAPPVSTFTRQLSAPPPPAGALASSISRSPIHVQKLLLNRRSKPSSSRKPRAVRF